MSLWCLIAPGPSASAHDAARVAAAGIPIGAVGNAFQLVESPAFIAATDAAWWSKYPEARNAKCKKFAMHQVRDVERIRIPGVPVCNSGVLGLECAKREGATEILLLGFDMHGTHFFGQYTNGLSNTTEAKRKQHIQQYKAWQRNNPSIKVLNCTKGSALRIFPFDELTNQLCSENNYKTCGI